jgi:cysteine dioxygenase
MKTQSYSPVLDRLKENLDGLNQRATVEQLREWLAGNDVSAADVANFARFDDDRYLRNLVFEGEHYHLLVLCWRSGQRSPIHNHAGSTCGFRVLTGIATETIFEKTPSKLIKPVSSEDQPAGTVRAAQDEDTHQVSNLQADGDDLVTLHIYSPPLFKMDVFSLIDPHVGEFRPMVLEHSQGSGI